ncbi:hypothetical protein Tsubulata_013456 [Turnera subulata]|uniref:Leucine-rich repeat-containing N-terminal plant-type domain-containing protein n=1 Tax=Turnera subulata TaxID=218843 RepID=A0A9Q0JKG8_9ROSI|nr:hypothetical protein Tsubulata_013456 [Turnera subulata]
MAKAKTRSSPLLFLATLLSFLLVSHQQPALDSAEQDSAYSVLDSINPDIPWRSLYPDDLCLSAPHGVVCDYFTDEDPPTNSTETAHISELSFGYVSDYTPNPPCTPNSTLDPLIFTSFKYLRKLFFYKCFTETPVSWPEVSGSGFGAGLEELVLIENPALVGSLDGIVGNFTNLRRLVLTGNGVSGNIPDKVGDLVDMEELTLSRNRLSGKARLNLARLSKLRVLDLSQNYLDGNVPESMGNLSQLLKLDLSSNGFYGKIPESLGNLQRLEFLDLSFNRFGNFGVPLFLGGMPRLREVYLSGNMLGGHIPEIWGKLGGISGIGFSNMGLVGSIPASMGLHLRNLCYLGLDNNRLEGEVPEEFGFLEFVNEINLENNNLTGRIPFTVNFTAKIGEKLKLKGNSGLCVGEDLEPGKSNATTTTTTSLGQLKLCKKSGSDIPNAALFREDVFVASSSMQGMLSSVHLLVVSMGLFYHYCSLVI